MAAMSDGHFVFASLPGRLRDYWGQPFQTCLPNFARYSVTEKCLMYFVGEFSPFRLGTASVVSSTRGRRAEDVAQDCCLSPCIFWTLTDYCWTDDPSEFVNAKFAVQVDNRVDGVKNETKTVANDKTNNDKTNNETNAVTKENATTDASFYHKFKSFVSAMSIWEIIFCAYSLFCFILAVGVVIYFKIDVLSYILECD